MNPTHKRFRRRRAGVSYIIMTFWLCIIIMGLAMIVLDQVVMAIVVTTASYCSACLPADYTSFILAIWNWKVGLVLVALGVFVITASQREKLGL